MRIVYLINGLNGGGAAFPMTRLVGLMRERGHDARVVALMAQDGRAAPRLEQAGIPYQIIGSGFGDYLGQAWRLIAHLRRERPDLIWTSLTRGTVYGQLAGRLLGIPVVSWQHNAHLKPGNLAILRRTRGLTARWVADSESVRHFAESALGIAPELITVWPPFVADPEQPAALPWNREGRLRLGTLSRLHPNKRHAVLLRAFARARELDAELAARIELVIAGDGPEDAALKALAAELKLDVQFPGFLDRPGPFLASLHGYIQTSFKEGFCISVHEAMQAGLPVISTKVGELAYSVRPGETGWLCEVGDVEALAQAMLAMVRAPAAAAAMGARARDWVLDRYAQARFRATGDQLLADAQALVDARRAARG